MKNKYYLQIIDSLFKSMIEDIIYKKRFSDYTLERLKEIIEEE